MKVKELLEKPSKELKKIEKDIQEGIKSSTKEEEKKILQKDLQQLNLVEKILSMKGVKEVLLNNTSPRETLSGLKDEDVNFLVNNLLLLQREKEKELNEAITRLWKSAGIEKRIRKQFNDFLTLLKDHSIDEVYEQGWRVLKMNSAEGKKMVDLLSRYEQIIENRFGDKNWLDFVPTEIGVFTEMRAEINSLTEKFKQALKQFQRQNRRGR